MQLLHIDSAITGSNPVSRQLTAQVVAAWDRRPPRHTGGLPGPGGQRPGPLHHGSYGPAHRADRGLSEVQVRENAVSEQLVSQFLAADVVVSWCAVLQLQHPHAAQGLDRLHRPARPHLPVHGQRPLRAGPRARP